MHLLYEVKIFNLNLIFLYFYNRLNGLAAITIYGIVVNITSKEVLD